MARDHRGKETQSGQGARDRLSPARLAPRPSPTGELVDYPPPERWDDWVEYDGRAWPARVARRYMLFPTTCFSSGGRFGYVRWTGPDRPSPDSAHARHTLLGSAHLESGHYFRPPAQRIIESTMKGGKLCVIDPRLSNTASMATDWLPAWPGTEAALLLAFANVLIQEDLYDRDFLRRWVNWEEYLRAEYPTEPVTFETFERILKTLYAPYTPEFAER